MDGIDLAILDQMTNKDAILFGGLDPRVSPESMAKRLGMDPSTIRARIRGWQTSGFLHRWHILPHPALLGAVHFVAYANIPNVQARHAVRHSANLIEGTVCIFEHVHGWMGFGFFAESERAAKRRVDLLASIDGVEEMRPPGRVALADCAPTMTDSDWRVLLALRAHPEAPMTEIAKAAGVSKNTASTRFRSLVDRCALFSIAELDFTKFTGGVLVRCHAELDPDADALGLARRFGASHRPVSFVRETRAPDPERPRQLHFMMHLDSLAALDDVEAAFLAMPGTRSVETTMPRSFSVMENWMDERLEAVSERVGMPEAAARPAHDATS